MRHEHMAFARGQGVAQVRVGCLECCRIIPRSFFRSGKNRGGGRHSLIGTKHKIHESVHISFTDLDDHFVDRGRPVFLWGVFPAECFES